MFFGVVCIQSEARRSDVALRTVIVGMITFETTDSDFNE
jgi:hypothetical protein